MKHIKMIITLGIVVALVPFLGFPSSWKNIIFLILGSAIATLAFRIFMAVRAAEHEDEEPVDEAHVHESMTLREHESAAAHE